MLLVYILFLGFLDPSSAFHVANVQHSATSLSTTAFPEGGTTTLDLGSSVGSNTELWLDLRGTRIFPSTAIQRLEEDLGLSDIVDRIVLWDDGNDNNKDTNFGNFVFVDANNGDLSSRPSGKVTGRLMSLAAHGYTDPMVAIETNAKGGWVLLDSKDVSDNDVRMSGLESLVGLLVACSASGSAGVVVLGEPKKDSTMESSFENGGIALTCATKADVFHAAATLQALQSSSTTTSSGILVANSSSEVSDTLRLQSAAVLPFDDLLWATAAIVFRGDER
jgi:hypothetical protein